jgi:hypothetical protein
VTGIQLDEVRMVGLMKSGMPLRERMAHIEPAAAAELTSAFLSDAQDGLLSMIDWHY